MVERRRNGDQGLVGGPRYPWVVLALIGVGVLISTLDASIVNIALPTIMVGLGATLDAVTWVVVAYLLTIAVLLLPFGRLGDMVGRKPIFTVGLALFAVGSALCGLSAGVEQLVAFRVLQAVGAAMITAVSFAIVTAVFPPSQRGIALGINGAVVAIGFTLGPALGGLLIGSLGWRSIFYITVPIAAVGTVAAWRIMDERRISGELPAGQRHFDWAGTVSLALALVVLLLLLNLAPETGWLAPQILLLGAAFLLFSILFLTVESRVAQPLVDLSLFRRRIYAAGNVAGLLSFLAISANAYLMPLFLQLVLGFDPLLAGIFLAPTALMLAVVAPISGWLSDRLGARVLSSVGLAINGVALLMLSNLGADTDYPQLLAWLLLLGLGQGLFQAPNNRSVMGDVPRNCLGIGGAILSSMRNLGQVVGVAVAASFLLGSLAGIDSMVDLETLQIGVPGSGIDPAALPAFMEGMRRAYFAAAAFAALGVLASLVRGSGGAEPASLPRRMGEAEDARPQLRRRRAGRYP